MYTGIQSLLTAAVALALFAAALALHASEGLDTYVFLVSCLAIVPLAFFMGKATEAIAERAGPGVGGLLNATFGNAAELIIALAAMRAGMDQVVKASLTGSIIGNLLFVYGLAAIVGGLRREKQTFNATAASASATMLLVAVTGLVVPAVFGGVVETSREHMGVLSTLIAVILLGSYVAGLVFSLVTHRHLFDGGGHGDGDGGGGGRGAPRRDAGPLWSHVAVLIVATAGVAVMSELLVHSVEVASHHLGFTETFVGVFVIAVIGNAAEHSTAVWMAAKDKMDLAIGIAVESSKQIALFVGPLLVLLSLVLREDQMTLEFTLVEVLAVVVCTVILKFTCDDGESNWLEGVQLIALYLILGVIFYFTP